MKHENLQTYAKRVWWQVIIAEQWQLGWRERVREVAEDGKTNVQAEPGYWQTSQVKSITIAVRQVPDLQEAGDR